MIDKKLYSLYKKIKNQFPYSDMCIWETTWLNKYMVHQVISNNIIVEIDKEAASAILAFLQGSLKNVYLNPGKHEIETACSLQILGSFYNKLNFAQII